MATQAERNARLDDLGDAVTAWSDKKTRRLQGESTLLKKVLKGRTGAERLNSVSTEAASALLVDELSQFLTGD